MTAAMAPLTMGVAAEVPLNVIVVLSGPAAFSARPGATISTSDPVLEK